VRRNRLVRRILHLRENREIKNKVKKVWKQKKGLHTFVQTKAKSYELKRKIQALSNVEERHTGV